jgi:D-alanine-D-alanine ligase
VTRVAVLKGGRSAEREVSLNTGAQVASALVSSGYDVVEIDAAADDFIVQLQTSSADVVFICLHGRFGEDGTVQGLLELLGMAYVGSRVLASALAMDKVMSKSLYACWGIPTPDYVGLDRGDPWTVEDLVAHLGEKVVVKPCTEGSSIGMTIVHGADELPDAIEKAFASDARILVERFVTGVEVTVGVLGTGADTIALPTLEIVPEHEFYDYDSKYLPGMSKHIIPAGVSDAENAECARLAVESHRALGCRHISRTDTIVTEAGEIFVLETNTIPGMTSTSLVPDAARAAGIEFPELCAKLVAMALAE